MSDKTGGPKAPASEVEEAANSELLSQLTMMIRALFGSSVIYALLLLGFGVFVVIVATAYAQILLNQWNQPFYNALSNRDFPEFVAQLYVFVEIAAVLLVLNVIQRWLVEMARVKLREGLVQDLISEWLAPGRAFKLASAGAIGVNPDQRMHEDARHLTELSTDLGVGLLQSTILLVSFVSVLWALSSGFIFNVGGRSFSIPGYMVWAAVAYSGSASILSYMSGRRLIPQNAARYAREAELRFSLMRVNEHIDAIMLAGGEADEERRIGIDLRQVLVAMRRLVSSLTRLTWVTAGYGWFTIVAPILVAAPVYFSGNLSFGGLMMAVGAFNQVQSSLRWFVDNFSAIADWRATLLRVASFRSAVLATDRLRHADRRLTADNGAPGELVLDDITIVSPSGGIKLREGHVVVKAGERVSIVAEPGANKELLFRALAGLWPWGSGRVAWPKGEAVSYIPRTPYVPPGQLREVLAYPTKVGNFEDAQFAAVLARVGLERLTTALASSRRWEHELNDDERRSIAIARVLLHKTDWVLIDEAFDSADSPTLTRFIDIVDHELAKAGLIYIGREDLAEKLRARVVHLIKDPSARPSDHDAAPPAAADESQAERVL